MWWKSIAVVGWKKGFAYRHATSSMRHGDDGFVRLIASTSINKNNSTARRATVVNSYTGSINQQNISSGSSGSSGSQSDDSTTTKEMSKRKAFRSLNLDLKLLQDLDELNLGIIRRRRSRVIVGKRLSPNGVRKGRHHILNRHREKPFPFKYKGKLIQEVEYSDEIPSQFHGNPPEIAIVGRSNVGKSTLLNALIGFDESFVQKSSTSNKPGETRQLKFYQLGFVTDTTSSTAVTNTTTNTTDSRHDRSRDSGRNNVTIGKSIDRTKETSIAVSKRPALVVVDMPGYGFAFMNDADRQRCQSLCLDYLVSNPERNRVLKRVVFLLDARHGIKLTDIQYLNRLQNYLYSKVMASSSSSMRTTSKKATSEVFLINSSKSVAEVNQDTDGLEHQHLIEVEGAMDATATDYNASIDKESLVLKEDDDEDDVNVPLFIEPDASPLEIDFKTVKRLSQSLGWKLQVVLTKCDLVERNDLCRRIRIVEETLKEKFPALFHSMLRVVPLSAVQGRGVEELQRDLGAVVPALTLIKDKNRKNSKEYGVDEAYGRYVHGIDRSYAKRSERGSGKDYVKGSEKGSGKDYVKGSERRSGKDYVKGSEKGSGNDYVKGSERGSGNDYVKGSERGSGKDYVKGSEKGSGKDYVKGSERRSGKDYVKGSERGSGKDYVKGSEKGSGKDYVKGSEKGGKSDNPRESNFWKVRNNSTVPSVTTLYNRDRSDSKLMLDFAGGRSNFRQQQQQHGIIRGNRNYENDEDDYDDMDFDDIDNDLDDDGSVKKSKKKKKKNGVRKLRFKTKKFTKTSRDNKTR